MGFFTGEQKKIAKKCSASQIYQGYQQSDLELVKASYMGDSKALKRAMKEHKTYEYAMLYQNTPEFKKKQRKR